MHKRDWPTTFALKQRTFSRIGLSSEKPILLYGSVCSKRAGVRVAVPFSKQFSLKTVVQQVDRVFRLQPKCTIILRLACVELQVLSVEVGC